MDILYDSRIFIHHKFIMGDFFIVKNDIHIIFTIWGIFYSKKMIHIQIGVSKCNKK